MEFNLHQHLINLKIFSDFNRSRISTLQRFIDWIEAGNNPLKVGNPTSPEEKYEDPHFDYEPTDKELAKSWQAPPRNYFDEIS